MKPNWQRVYLVAASCITLTDVFLISSRNPYGDGFLTWVTPTLAMLIALLWLLTRIAPMWRFLGMLLSFAVSAGVDGLYQREEFANFVPTLVIMLFCHASLLWFLTLKSSDRSTIAVTHGAVAFVILFGLYLRFTGKAELLGSRTSATTPAFLFWSPLCAALLWAGAVAFGGDKTTRIVLVCAVAQVGIGLLDVSSLGIRWAIPAGILVWALALAVAARLAVRWNAPVSS